MIEIKNDASKNLEKALQAFSEVIRQLPQAESGRHRGIFNRIKCVLMIK